MNNTSTAKMSYEQMESEAAVLSSAATQMEQILAAVETELNKVGSDGVWQSEAATEWQNQFVNLKAKFPEFRDAVQSCSTCLTNLVASYKELDSQFKAQ